MHLLFIQWLKAAAPAPPGSPLPALDIRYFHIVEHVDLLIHAQSMGAKTLVRNLLHEISQYTKYPPHPNEMRAVYARRPSSQYHRSVIVEAAELASRGSTADQRGTLYKKIEAEGAGGQLFAQDRRRYADRMAVGMTRAWRFEDSSA